MSVDSQHNFTVECEYPECDETGKKWEFQGEYCSSKCELKHEGREKLGGLVFDHCTCFTCGSELKEIEPPKPDHAFDVTGTGWYYDPEEDLVTLERFSQEETRTAAVGFQYKTPNATFGEKEHNERVVTGTVCENCGNTDHTAHIPFLVDTHQAAGFVASYLVEGETEFDPETLHRSYSETEDMELAVGKALR